MGGSALKLLLDTHIWIWTQLSTDKLSARVRRALENQANEVWLSPVSIWELVLLVEKRRVALDREVREWATSAASMLKEAPLTSEIVLETARFSLPHDDPADRLLVATARSLGLTLVTSDARLLASKTVPVLPNL
ncbi:MAG TPA: type II toxin-antitoxin system VapC family toxin [Terriglobia bacterium]|nr:type II toxin-antitoxin system VapC family toxin [Terriglobia bacterium]